MNTSDGREYYGFGIDNSQLRREAQQAISIFDSVGSRAEAEGARIDTAFRKAGQAMAAYFTARQLTSFITSVVKVRSEIEALEISFETLLGNKDKAAELFGEIKDFAVNTPMQLDDLAKGAQTLLGFNIEAEKVMPILRQIGDISMGSSEKFNSLILAFSQMSSTGKLMGQDLLQMINAGFNPLVEMSKTTGKSIAELKDDMSAGAISADMVAEAFAHAAGEGGMFNGMLEKQSHGLQGAISNLQGAWDDMLNDIGSKTQGVFADGINLATEAVKHYELFANAILSLAAAYGTYKAILVATVAIEKAKALADNIRLVMMFRKELGLLTAAQQAFNITAWANPYVLLAAAIVGVATALYLYADNASNAEKAQEKLNEQRDDWEKHLDEEEQKINELVGIIQDKTETDYAQIRAYEELKKVCPAITNAYTQEKLAALELADVRKQLNEVQEQETYDNAKQNLERYTWLLQEATNANGNWTKMSKEAWDAIRDELGTGLLKNKVEQLQTIVNGYQEQVDEIENIRKQAEEQNKPVEVKIAEAKADLEQIQAEYDKAKKKLEEEQAKVKSRFGLQILTLWYEVRFRNAQSNLKNAQSRVQSLEAEKAAQTTYQQDYDAAKRAWNDAKKKLAQISRDKANYTQKQYKEAVDAEEKARKAFKALGGETTTVKQDKSEQKKQRERVASLRKAEIELQQILRDNSKARIELEQELKMQETENAIALETDAAERRRKQLELEQQKERAQLQKQQDAAIDAEIQRQKSYFNATENEKAARNENYVKNVFTDADIDQSEIEKIKSQYAVLFKQLEEQQKRGQVALMQVELESMRDYLKEYGSFEQQKLAITEDYEQRIKKAETEGERLRLKKEKEKALSNMTFESISMGIDWHALLSGVGSLSHEMMKPLLEQLEAYTKTDEYAQADIQEREKVVELIQDLRQYIGTDKDAGWEDLATAIRDFSASVANYKELEKQEQAAIAARENAKGQLQRGEITQGDFDRIDAAANDLGQKTADARNEMQELGKTLNETSEKVKNYVSPLTATLNKLGMWEGLDGFSGVKSSVASFDNLKGALDSVLPNIGNGMAKTIGTNLSSALGSTLGSIGSGITSLLSSGMGNIIGIVAQIPKLILDLVNAVKDMVTGVLESITEIVSLRWIDDLVVSILDSVGSLIDAIFDLPENLYKIVESIVVNGVGSLLNTVLGRVGNILSFGFLSSGGPADWFTNSNAKEVQETIDRLTERNELLQTAIEDLTDEIKSSKGTKSVSAYRDAYKLQKETNANYLQMAQAQAGYHGSHHSWNYYWGGFTQEQINRLSSQIGRSWNGDIWNLSPEEMKMLRTNVDMWQRIQGTGKGGYGGRLTEKLDDYIDQAGKLEDLTNQLYEGLTGMSFDSMYDSFIDTLMDMDASTKDFADSISEYFMRAMLSNKIGELYSEKLEKWWKKFGKAMEDNELTETERNALQNEYMQYVDEAMKLRDEIAAATGYDSTSSAASQDSTKKGFATASQDSIDELSGRFTAIQLNSEVSKVALLSVAEDVKAVRMQVLVNMENLAEIKEISLLAIGHLETISKNTHELFEMNERLDKIEKNTRKL